MKIYNLVIVENDEDEQYFMQMGFEKTGLFNILALQPNGNGLFEWLEANPGNMPDIILSDLNMPGKNGNDIIIGITSNPLYQHIPVVITSTSSTSSTRDKCMKNGALAYMVKPDTFINYEPFAVELYNKLHGSAAVSDAQKDDQPL